MTGKFYMFFRDDCDWREQLHWFVDNYMPTDRQYFEHRYAEGLEAIENDETFVPNTWYISADFIALAEGVSTFGQSLENYTIDAIRENDDRDKLVIAQSGYSYLIDSEGKIYVKIP